MKTKNKPKINTNVEEVYQSPLSWWGEAQEKSLTLAKWMAFFEAVNIIADKAEEKSISLDDIDFKPLEIRKYMAATEDIYLRKILEEDYKIKICHNDDASKEIKDMFPELQLKEYADY